MQDRKKYIRSENTELKLKGFDYGAHSNTKRYHDVKVLCVIIQSNS